MKPEYLGVWRKITEFSPDVPGAEFPFSARLAKENEWPKKFADQVIEEYKKFAFLAAAADHPVSPSDAVDQAWHLHLTYTKNYWKDFCGEVLGKPLHHHPTEGGNREREKFHDWYQKTLESYRRFFDSEPPRDIWPDPEDKLAQRSRFARVDKAANWVIPKPRLSRQARNLIAITAIAGMGAGCAAIAGQGTNPLNWSGPNFLRFFLLLFPSCLVLAAMLRWSLRKTTEVREASDLNLDPYEVAYLNEGRILAVNAAITSLVDQKALANQAATDVLITKSALPNNAHALEKEVYEAVAQPGGAKVSDVREAAKPEVEKIATELQNYGLVLNDSQARKALWWPLMLAAIAPVLGVIKVGIGISRDRPVAYLIVLCVISTLITLAGFARRPLRSRAGDELLRKLRAQRLELKKLPRYVGLAPAELAMALGLFGMAALADTGLADLQKTLQPPPSASSGCGSSCGGGCGGGCGGCGGCGGD